MTDRQKGDRAAGFSRACSPTPDGQTKLVLPAGSASFTRCEPHWQSDRRENWIVPADIAGVLPGRSHAGILLFWKATCGASRHIACLQAGRSLAAWRLACSGAHEKFRLSRRFATVGTQWNGNGACEIEVKRSGAVVNWGVSPRARAEPCRHLVRGSGFGACACPRQAQVPAR